MATIIYTNRVNSQLAISHVLHEKLMYDMADARGKRTIEQTAEAQATYSRKQLPSLPAAQGQ